jgi:hypothetical protein
MARMIASSGGSREIAESSMTVPSAGMKGFRIQDPEFRG